MNTLEILQTAYQRLEKLTPLREDCGRICSHICCQGQDEVSGMYVFPGEEALLSCASSLSITPTNIPLTDDKNILLAVCDSHCIRSERPLACRIFPLTPYVTRDGELKTIIDPRAVPLCPLTRQPFVQRIQPAFAYAVDQINQMLFNQDETRNFLVTLSRIIDETMEL